MPDAPPEDTSTIQPARKPAHDFLMPPAKFKSTDELFDEVFTQTGQTSVAADLHGMALNPAIGAATWLPSLGIVARIIARGPRNDVIAVMPFRPSSSSCTRPDNSPRLTSGSTGNIKRPAYRKLKTIRRVAGKLYRI
ncbi:hypothetical protein E4U61_002398 [Claviceps capensis]|nr:hypothetical protein E4U61_002398 [Claviceps capensis]